jgi:hypothetical protein
MMADMGEFSLLPTLDQLIPRHVECRGQVLTFALAKQFSSIGAGMERLGCLPRLLECHPHPGDG